MKVAVFNLAKILTGDIAAPVAPGDTITMVDGKITAIGTGGDAEDCDVAIDAGGMMAMPGLIDSHVHITFGDYTPRQKAVGFIESYTHGGVTTCISASDRASSDAAVTRRRRPGAPRSRTASCRRLSPPITERMRATTHDEAHASSTTPFLSVPMPSPSTSMTSPGLSQTGGSRRAPAPVGVPVAMTSPGTSVVNDEM